MFAKVNVNYDNIVAGDVLEAVDWLTGFPGFSFSLTYPTGDVSTYISAWNFISSEIGKKSVMTLQTARGEGKNADGIVLNHAYSIVGARTLTYNGKTYYLLRLYNPWRFDYFYTGAFNDNDPIWQQGSPKNKDVLGYSPDVLDGIQYIDAANLYSYFVRLTVSHDMTGYVESLAKVYDDPDNSDKYFTFKVTQNSTVYIKAFMYNQKMYPEDCVQNGV